MTGNTSTPQAATAPAPPPLTPGRAAQELGLKRTEFELAVQLGRVRTVPAPQKSGAARPGILVTWDEIARIRAGSDDPDALRRSVRVMGTTAAAETLHISTGRFTRFARLGLVTPVRFYLNRYRVIVWLYLADDLAGFASADAHTPLLKGTLPENLRAQLDAGVDLRARNWRGRYTGSLLRLTDDPWARAAIAASLLPPDDLADLVGDPDERARLAALAPRRPVPAAEGSLAAQRVALIATAQDPDEIQQGRTSLELSLREARSLGSAPHPAARPTPALPCAADRPPRGPASRGPAGSRPPGGPLTPFDTPAAALKNLRRLLGRALS
ncbi:DUF6397 family protein [Streptomyces sp. NPDC050560]|uniref:DUF6397 family protein n=1 Tax=Streptomyces sp. NPDC050560 TaxID=3365630 RepID=UPI0037AD76F1